MYRYIIFLILALAINFCTSRPSVNLESNLDLLVATRNCRLPMRWIGGACRDLSDASSAKNRHDIGDATKKAVNVEENESDTKNVINVPQNCPNGQEWINGACRDVWNKNSGKDTNYNIVTVPPNCPSGQEWINNQCRDVWASLLEALKDVKPDDLTPEYISDLVVSVLDNPSQEKPIIKHSDQQNSEQPKNVITVPNQCPNGFRPDSNGICREIW